VCYIELELILIRMLRRCIIKVYVLSILRHWHMIIVDIIKKLIIKSHTILIQDIFTKITKGMRTK